MRVALWMCMVASSVGLAGQSIEGPQFEAASIKPNRTGSTSASIGPTGDRVRGSNVSVLILAGWAYGLRHQQIAGLPEWATTERFDVMATTGGKTSFDDMGRMMQALLATRFGFVARLESREMPVWVMTLARRDGRLGPRMRPCASDCSTVKGSTSPGLGVMTSTGLPAERLAERVGGLVQGHVIDRTGLTGTYDLDLEWAPESTPPDAIGDRVSAFTALQEQWGLKLEPSRAPLPVLVVDRVARPTED